MDTTTETTWHPTWIMLIDRIARTDRPLAVRVTGATHVADVCVARSDLMETLVPLADTGHSCEFRLTATANGLLVLTSGDPF